MVQYKIKISGKVQGVGFRYFTKKHADILGLAGWVKNMYDGRVFVLVQGAENDIEIFTDYLKNGPSMSQVKNIVKVKMPVIKEFTDFYIR